MNKLGILEGILFDEGDERGIRISYLGDAFKLTTKEEHKEYYQKLVDKGDVNTFSPSTLEVLAIIAYNGPITRVEIDEMRGVSSAYIIRRLVAMGLVKEVGKSKLPGRLNMYKTTREFLDSFGLASLSELPELDLKEEEKEEETELFSSIYKEENNDVGV